MSNIKKFSSGRQPGPDSNHSRILKEFRDEVAEQSLIKMQSLIKINFWSGEQQTYLSFLKGARADLWHYGAVRQLQDQENWLKQ